jgi:hypothetical protein
MSSGASGVPPAFERTQSSRWALRVREREPVERVDSRCVGSIIGGRLGVSGRGSEGGGIIERIAHYSTLGGQGCASAVGKARYDTHQEKRTGDVLGKVGE